MATSKPILIVGYPRSGTRFTAQLLYRAGLCVGHERRAEHATVSWLYAVDAPPPGRWAARAGTSPSGPDSDWSAIFHQVRDPLKVIACCMEKEDWGQSLAYRQQHTSLWEHAESQLECSALLWYEWNTVLCERRASMTFQVETIREVWPDIIEAAGMHRDTRMPAVATSVGHEDHKDLSWKRVQDECHPSIFTRLQNAARKYGYTADP